MTPDEAIEIVAQHVIADLAGYHLDDAWEDLYPDLGEYDWERVVAEVRLLCPTQTAFREAYDLLAARADGEA